MWRIAEGWAPGAVGPGADHAWLPAGPRAAGAVRLTLMLLVAGGFVAGIVVLAWRGRPHSLFEVAAALTAASLLSGITWEAHLVGLLFTASLVLAFALSPRPGAPAGAGPTGAGRP